jgi:hypothetical protein
MRLACAALSLGLCSSPAFAQREPVIVIPGRPDVPVYINGVDASWAVVEGEFGLDRPGAVTPTIVYRPLVVSVPYNVPGYFPRDGKRPGYGRLEITPPPDRPLPPKAPSFFRSWSSQSAPGPATDYAPYPAPPIVVAPTFGQARKPQSNGGGGPNRAEPGRTGNGQKNP